MISNSIDCAKFLFWLYFGSPTLQGKIFILSVKELSSQTNNWINTPIAI